MSKKMIVGFSPTENMWAKEDFRILIKEISIDPLSVLYVITTNTNQDFIDKLVIEGSINADNVYIVTDNNSIISKITELKVLMFFSDDQALNADINGTVPIQLVKDNVTGCQAILINNTLDQYLSQMKYYTYMDFWTKQIKKYW